MKVKIWLIAYFLVLSVGLWGCLQDPFETSNVVAMEGENELSDPIPTLNITTEEKLEEDSEADEQGHKTTLLVGGDIMFSKHVLEAYDQAGGIHGVLDEDYRNAIEEANLFIANQEFPFSDRGKAAVDKQFTFRLPTQRIEILKEMKTDIVSLANNHVLDFGRDALADTLETLDQAAISHIGAGADLNEAKTPVIKEIDGIKVGFLGATRVIPVADWTANRYSSGMLATYDPAVLLAAIEELRPQCDYLVVYVHWGIEQAEKPEAYQRTLGQQYLDAGADLVVGSHSHVLQGIEFYKGKPIVYSLGNFVFGSSIPQTALLQVELVSTAENIHAVLSLIPGSSAKGYTETLTDPGKIEEFYRHLQELSPGVVFTGGEAVRTIEVLAP